MSKTEKVSKEKGQWVKKVLKFSTQYNGWPASNIEGKSNTYPQYGDLKTSWAPSQSSGKQEFLELQFKNKVNPRKIEIYETFNPGSLVKISAKDSNKKWVTLWKSKRKNEAAKSRIFKPKLEKVDFQTNEIRLDIDTVGSIGFYEIDAVKLIGDEDGEDGSDNDDEDKKDKKKIFKSKSKYVFWSSNAYSLIYPNYFNNKKFSDIVIKFQESGNLVYCHKIILENSSEYFAKLFNSGMSEEKNNEIIIDKSDNEEIFIDYLKFLYTGSYEFSDESKFILFSITANKYLTETKDLKIPAKSYLNGIIAYVEKDLENRKALLENLLENVNFKSIERDDLLKVYKKKKFLQTSTTFLNILLTKDADSDSDSESKSSGSNSDSKSSDSS